MSVYLIRHASAGARGFGAGDLERPLDDSGRSQAIRLAKLLGTAQLDQVFSSSAVRCVETVEPLAGAHGLVVQRHRALVEGSTPHAALELVEASIGKNTAYCSHGDVIPGLLQLMVNRGMEIGPKQGLAKGSLWTIETSADQFVTGTYTKIKPQP